MYGTGDILNVAFASSPSPSLSSLHMGILFSFVGLGCLVGPFVSNAFTDMKRPETLQLSCIVSYGVMVVGFMGLGFFEGFLYKCVCTMVRSSGAAIMWTNSSILLQKFCDNKMLGRVSAVDYGIATLAEGASSVIASILHDGLHLSAECVSYAISLIGCFIIVGWTRFHLSGGGAAAAKGTVLTLTKETGRDGIIENGDKGTCYKAKVGGGVVSSGDNELMRLLHHGV